MKLATFSTGDRSAVGRIKDDQIVALPSSFGTMADLIGNWPEAEAAVRAFRGPAVPLGDIRLLAPVPRPGKIMAIGLNYADHIREIGGAAPLRQTWFSKMSTAAHAPFEPIVLPKVSEQVDYEAELVAVIGQGGRHIDRAAAPAAVFGYCVGNDVSVRDWQMATSQ